MLPYDAAGVTARRVIGVLLAVLALGPVAALGGDVTPSVVAVERAASPGAGPDDFPAHPLVGAHYHVWYPTNFDQGFLRGHLDPPQQPALGRYRSDDPAVAEQQIEWASAAGIDFFTIDWWPSRPQQNANALSGLMQADNIGDIDVAVFYELWDLGFDPGRGTTEMDPAAIERFAADMEALAATFFEHPSYLRIGGRPVVILYLSRTMTGDVAGAVAAARARLAALGTDVFFIGDEVFWDEPRPDRMRLFDAVTAYNLYENELPEHRGYASQTSLVADQLALYDAHRAAMGGAVPLLPTVFPGYNDRGVRPSLAHFAIPRRWARDQPEGSLLREMIDRIGRPLLDPRLPIIFVTSWNEWNEDTAIEPLAPAPPTSADSSDSDTVFSDGYAYAGGADQLLALRDEVTAVAGQVLDRGRPVPGLRVEARSGGRLLAADLTDRAGRFTLSRWLLAGGEVEVSGPAGGRQVQLDPDRTVWVELPAP